MPSLVKVTTKWEGVKNAQNFDHVIYDWPLWHVHNKIVYMDVYVSNGLRHAIQRCMYYICTIQVIAKVWYNGYNAMHNMQDLITLITNSVW